MKNLNGRYVTDSGKVILTEEGIERMIVGQNLNSDILVDRTYETELFQENMKKVSPISINFYENDLDVDVQYNWNTPEPFKSMDIEEYIFSLSNSPEEDDRIALEMSMFSERDLYPLLRHIIFLVDHFRKNNIFWGVGRGSSVSSYVLFLIGIHKIDSIRYGLDITDFLK